MASTSGTEVAAHNGFTTLPGLKVGPYASAFTNLKAYTFTGTDTDVISATSTERSYTVSGLSTNDFVLSFQASTGFASGALVAQPRISATDTLGVTYVISGTSTDEIPGPFSGCLITTQIISLASSTTT